MKDKKQFENHQLWMLVDKLQSDDRISTTPTDTRDYLNYLLADLQKRKAHTNPYFVQEGTLQSLCSYLNNINGWLPGNISSIDDYVGRCFEELSKNWPAHNGRQVADIQKDTYDAYVAQASSELVVLKDEVDKVQELRNEYEAQISELQSSIEEVKTDSVSELDQICSDAENRAKELAEKYEQVIAESKDNSEVSLKAIEKDYTNSLEKAKEEADNLLQKVKTRSSSISGWVIADEYGKYARNKSAATVIYDLLAVVFAIVGIGLVAFALVGLEIDDTSATVFKFAVSVASFTVSGFLFRRGTFNQREAKAAKRTELTLRQYEPFVANLSEDEKIEITKEIAERIFVKGDIDDKTNSVAEALGRKGISDKELAMILEIVKIVSKEV